ncbi:MAG: SDR family NAD(P)-dependent oxidoreductase [Sphingobium sp.]
MTATPSFDLTGRVALVTGASSGIGANFARILSRSGASVVLAARRTDRLSALREEIEAAGGRALAVSVDVTDEASIAAAFDAAEAAFGTVDTIIANAGTSGEGAVLDLPVSTFDETTDINLRGVFLTVREGARRLIADGSREKQNGRVVIITSITAHLVTPGLSIYSATKAALVHMGKIMAREWVRMGINVNMISPGYVKTEINADWFGSEAGAKQIAGFNRRRLMEEGDLDVALLYLASDASRTVTGTEITIDDGQSL